MQRVVKPSTVEALVRIYASRACGAVEFQQLWDVPLNDDILSLEDHRADRTGAKKLAEGGVERALGKVIVVLLGVLKSGGDELEGDKLEAALLETLDNLPHETTLHSIGLKHDVAALVLVRKRDSRARHSGRGRSCRCCDSARLEDVAAGEERQAGDERRHRRGSARLEGRRRVVRELEDSGGHKRQLHKDAVDRELDSVS